MRITSRICGALALATAVAGAQDPPVYRSTTRIVQINVVVRDRHGPVTGLKAEDFALQDGRHVVAIRVFAANQPRAGAGGEALPPNFYSNSQPGNGAARTTAVLLDRLNTMYYSTSPLENQPSRFMNGALAFARPQLMGFLAEMEPSDRVALYSLGHTLDVLSDFSGDRERLRQIVAGYQAWSLSAGEVNEPAWVNVTVSVMGSSEDRQAAGAAAQALSAMMNAGNTELAGEVSSRRGKATIAALAAIARRMASIPGRKNLVWITASMPFSAATAARALNRADIAVYPVDARGVIPSFESHFQPRGQAAMTAIAEATGGRAYLNTNDIKESIGEAVRDGEVSYTLGFYPAEERVDNAWHDLAVEVKRPGVEVRYPKHYFAAAEPAVKTGVAEAVASPIESSTIPLKARVEHVHTPKPNSLLVLCSVDLHAVALEAVKGRRTGALEVYLVQQDIMGKVLNEAHSRLDIRLTEQRYAAYLRAGMIVQQAVPVRDRSTTLRVLVADACSGAVGSLIIPIKDVK